MVCSKCGAELLEGSRFCNRCGAPVAEVGVTPSDAELEHLAAEGDREAFADLYSRHSNRVYDFLLRLVRDPEEAADLMQETFLRAMRAFSTQKQKAAFSTWVLTIARNLALKRLRRRKRTVGLGERQGEDESPAYRQVDADRLADPQAAAEAREMAGLVWEAAAALEAKQYSLLDLHVRQGLESAEIAQVLGVSKGNAYTMMSRLRDAFEGAVASLFMLRLGRRQCPELNRLLEQRSMTALSPAVRKLIERHTTQCDVCQEQRRRVVSPANILGAFAPVALPLAVKQRVAEAAMASWTETAGGAAAAGLKSLLAHPTANLASVPTAWKAALIGGFLIVAGGGGLGGWIGVAGGLPGSGGSEAPAVGLPPVVERSPVPTPSVLPTAAVLLPAWKGSIAFRSSRDPKGTYVMNADGTDVVRIGGTIFPASYVDYFSEWSPDGSKLAFHKCPESPQEGGPSGLYVVNADGSGLKQLARSTIPCFTEYPGGILSWSPDGRRIVFRSEFGEPAGLYVVGADGSDLRYLADGSYPDWSPLGNSIAFRRRTGTDWQCEIHLIRPDGTGERLLATVPCESVFNLLYGPRPQWSPDASMLAFSANLEGPSAANPSPQRDIFIVSADGTGLTNVTNHSGDDSDPTWVDCRVPTVGCEARVTNVEPDPLNVRESPGTNQEVIAALDEGSTVCLVGSPSFEDGYKWWPVRAVNGAEGWVAAFDPKEPARPWVTATDKQCSGERVLQTTEGTATRTAAFVSVPTNAPQLTVTPEPVSSGVLVISNTSLKLDVADFAIYGEDEAPRHPEGHIFLSLQEEGIDIAGPNISATGIDFELEYEQISEYTSEVWIVHANAQLSYRIDLKDYDGELGLAQVKLRRVGDVIESSFIFLAHEGVYGGLPGALGGIVDITITPSGSGVRPLESPRTIKVEARQLHDPLEMLPRN